jgi:hypothetical protein
MEKAWTEISREIAYLAIELCEEDPSKLRYCDNELILWLLSLLSQVIDERVINMVTALERWSLNAQLWRARNYRGAYRSLLRHMEWYQAIAYADQLKWKLSDLEDQIEAMQKEGLKPNLKQAFMKNKASVRSSSAKPARDSRRHGECQDLQMEMERDLWQPQATSQATSHSSRTRTSSSFKRNREDDPQRNRDEPRLRFRQSRRDAYEAYKELPQPMETEGDPEA